MVCDGMTLYREFLHIVGVCKSSNSYNRKLLYEVGGDEGGCFAATVFLWHGSQVKLRLVLLIINN